MSKEADNLVILNQAKALEGMRQRLRSHGRKLSERQHRIKQLETMVILRDERITQQARENRHLSKLLEDKPESYTSELTRKCEEVDKQKRIIKYLQWRLE